MIFCEKSFARFFVRKKEIKPESKTTNKIKIRICVVGMPMISFIATAAPVLVFEIK